MIKLTFIRAANGVPLVKNRITGDSYPAVSEVNSSEFIDEHSEGLLWMFELLKMQADLAAALLTGELKKPLVAESRAGMTQVVETDYLILDVDADLPYTDRDAFLHAIGVDSSYIFQHSASSTTEESLRGHYFIHLDTPKLPRQIKLWLKGVNFSCFKQELRLSNNQQTLKWPLDIVVNDSGRIIYISPPIQSEDPIKERIMLVDKGLATFSLPAPDPTDVSALINQLRQQQNLKVLPKAGTETTITINPDEVKITGVKYNGNFTYLNLNGGDSWGYYFSETNPEIVRNFKGEANFRLKDLDIEMYNKVAQPTIMSLPKVLSEGKVLILSPLVFRDPNTDMFHQILHDNQNTVHKKYTTSSRARLNDFMTTNGGVKPTEIPDWDVSFDPTTVVGLDRKNQWFNLFEPTEYMQIDTKSKTPPKHIEKLIRHLTVDDECYSHFMNWLAFIYQKRRKTGTAWLFHGHTGTGKGTLFSKVLRPIFGFAHSHTCTVDTAFEMFNAHMEKCLILFIDEFDITDLSDSSKAFNKLKNYITEEQINIRAMRSQQVQVENFTNSIMGTNSSAPIKIDDADRRINLPPPQTKPLDDLQEWRDEIDNELGSFCEYLNHITVNEQKARTTIKNKTREIMVAASRTSHEDFFHAFKLGDLDFFLDNLLELQTPGGEFDYSRFENIIANWQDTAGTEIMVTNEQLLAVYHHLVSTKSVTPIKFGAICKNNGVVFERHIDGGSRHQAVWVTFTPPETAVDIPSRLPTGKLVSIK